MPEPVHTLLLRLDGPMQAWGTDSKFGIRETRTTPTKSGVLGLVAAALGRPREADITDLAALRFGVRVDRAGRVRRDFQTAGREGFYRASGKVERGDVIVSDRYYLADACFTAGLETDRADGLDRLEQIRRALLRPRWPLFLGRKAFPPAHPLALAVVPFSLADALRRADLPLGRNRHDRPRDGRYRFVLDADAALPDGTVDRRDELVAADDPLDFAARRFQPRPVVTVHLPLIDA